MGSVSALPTMLYVEDEDAAAFLLETAIQETGLAVQLCRVSDGEQALSFLSQVGPYEKAPKPALILLDLNLPRLDGFQFLERMRRNGSSIPVIVFTSSSLAADKTRALALGAQEFVTKPSNLDDFFSTVRTACARIVKPS